LAACLFSLLCVFISDNHLSLVPAMLSRAAMARQLDLIKLQGSVTPAAMV
jgi:hypothetical protein